MEGIMRIALMLLLACGGSACFAQDSNVTIHDKTAEREAAIQREERERDRKARLAAEDAKNALVGARQYRDAKEWVKSRAMYRYLLTDCVDSPEAVTADIELKELLKDPEATAAFEAVEAAHKRAEEAATREKRLKQATGQLRVVKEIIKNRGNPDSVREMLNKIINMGVGGDTEAEARELLKSFENP